MVEAELISVAFLPGAVGEATFWHPVGNLLPPAWLKHYFEWPGLGGRPPDPMISGFADLTRAVSEAITDGTDVVAQSLGGIIAMQLALDHPRKIRRLVLVATSGGVDVQAHGAADWRSTYRRNLPDAPAWLLDERPDLTSRLHEVAVPTLLLWGDADPMSPVDVGRSLESLLPDARLSIIAGGGHSLAHDHPDAVAPLIAAHLKADPAV